MKKLLSVLLVLALCLSFSTLALAEENDFMMPINVDEEPPLLVSPKPADPITVDVTISVKGELVLTREEVTVHDLNGDGSFNLDEALYCAHEQYYEGGAAAGFKSRPTEYGISMYKFWGDDSEMFGYSIDDSAFTMSLADPIKDGNHVAAYVYADANWSDQYTFFNIKGAKMLKGSDMNVILSANGFDAEWNAVVEPVVGATITINGVATEIVTDAEGVAKFPAFEQPGTYVISATCTETVIVPPAMIVEVGSFPDSYDHWASAEIETVVKAGIMNGEEADKFGVENPMTRDMLVTVLYRMAGGPAVEGEVSFTDVKPGSYYADAVAWAVQMGITNGYEDNTFRPNAVITREQLATFLYRFAKSQSMGTEAGENTNILSYIDAFDIPAYAMEPMQWAVGAQLLKGSEGYLNPNVSATRAEVATVLARFLPGVPMPIGSSMAE